LGYLICCSCIHKNSIRRVETTNKNIEIFLVDNLRGYCCEPSQRTGNRLVYTNAPVTSTIFSLDFFIALGKLGNIKGNKVLTIGQPLAQRNLEL
jgi:hypothetical protein